MSEEKAYMKMIRAEALDLGEEAFELFSTLKDELLEQFREKLNNETDDARRAAIIFAYAYNNLELVREVNAK